MTNIAKWSTTNLGTVMSTELNSLANGALATSATPYDNSANLNLYADIEILLAALSPTAGASVSVYVLESVDGTNFPAQNAADLAKTSSQLFFVMPMGNTASTAQRTVLRNMPLSPAKYTVGLINNMGVPLAASGNTVKFLAYSVNLNG
jgi:hypothetical protein